MDHQLSPHEHNRIYNDRIKPDFLDSVTPSANPRAIILGGQSGAGKSTIAQASVNELGGPKNVVRIDTDALRAYHPRFDEFASAGKNAATISQPDAQAWRDRLEHDAIASSRNLVVDGTLGWSPSAIQMAEKLQGAGYQVEARVISAHSAESQLGIAVRYYEGLANFGKARWVDRAYHDQVYPRIPETLEAFEQKKLVSAIRIINREGVEVHGQVLDANNRWSHDTPSSTALREDRERRGRDPVVIENHFKNWDSFEELLDKLKVASPDRDEMAALRRQHELDLVGKINERGPRARIFLEMGPGEIRTNYPNDESLKNASLQLSEAEKFAAALMGNKHLKKMVVDEVRYRLADQLDKNEKIERPVEKTYTTLERRLEREGPKQKDQDDGRGR